MKKQRIFKLITTALLIVMISLAACQKMEIVKLVGYVQGHVFNGNTNQTLDSVKVDWMVGGEKDSTTATADNGFTISGLPEGEYSIWFSKEGYTTVVRQIGVYKDNMSNIAVRGGESVEMVLALDQNLYPLSGGLRSRLYKQVNGVNIPAAGVTVLLDYNGTYNSSENSYRFVPNLYETTTDAEGYFSFTNVPATTVSLRIPSFTDDDGNSFYTYIANYTLDAESQLSINRIILVNLNDPITLVSTNLWEVPNVGTDNFTITDDITLTFNKDVSETSTLSKGYVYLERYNSVSFAWNRVAVSLDFTNNIITINPDDDLSENASYRVRYNVYSDQEYDNTSATINFKTIDNMVPPAQITNFEINYNSMGAGWVPDYNTKTIVFSFDAVNNAEYYEIYAKDTYHNMEYVNISTIVAPDYLQGTVSIAPTLTSMFDYYYDDGLQTPLSHGVEVSYVIRAVNSAGAGPFSDVITVRDQTSFNSGDLDISNLQSASADNLGGSNPITITMSFNTLSTQYADTTVTPIVKLYNGGTEITPFTSSVSWETTYSGVITFEVPANTDYSGMEIRLYGVTDSSGNDMDPTDYEPETLY